MNSIPEWNPRVLLQSPMFAPLHPVLARLDSGNFPSLHDCNALLAEYEPPIMVGGGMPLRFVKQERGRLNFEAQYEPRCYLAGEVQTRENNWHDLFNALVWRTFPESKAAINARHYRALVNSPHADVGGRRGSERDMLTLFDESGVAVAYADDELAALLRGFRWKELFWQRREQVNAVMGFHLFGHGLYEKAMQPYPGMTGQGLLLKVEREFFAWPPEERQAHLDGVLANYFFVPGNCRSTRELAPVPLLGVPGWTAENGNSIYYDDTRYFRRKRGTVFAS